MHDPAHTVIGYIVDVQGNALSATLVEDEQGHAPTVTIGDEDIVVGRIGSYVAIRQNAVNIIAMVTRMTEQEALADPTIETPGEKAHAFRSQSAWRGLRRSVPWIQMGDLNVESVSIRRPAPRFTL